MNVILGIDHGTTRTKVLALDAEMLVVAEVAALAETSARGTALLAGLGLGWWTLSDIAESWRASAQFEPTMREDQRDALYSHWQRAVYRAMEWEV